MYFRDLPSSFKSPTGKIRYRVKAYLSRSMRLDSKANAPFTVISKASCSPEMMVIMRLLAFLTHLTNKTKVLFLFIVICLIGIFW